MSEKVSIVIPVYNAEKFLPNCIQGVIAQSYQNIEVILVDDGSVDSSGKLCDEYAKSDKRVIVIHQNNQGVANARNAALDVATGEYIFFIDSDDCIEKTCIEKLVKKSIAENADITMCNYDYVDEAFNKVEVNKFFYVQRNSETITGRNALFNIGWYLHYSVWGKLYKKELFKTLRFPKDKRISEDHYVLTRATALSKIVAFVSEVLYHYVQQEASITHKAEPHFDTSEAFFDRAVIMYENKIHWNAVYKQLLVSIRSLYRTYKLITKTKENENQYKKILAYYKKTIYQMDLSELEIRRRVILKLCVTHPVFSKLFIKIFNKYDLLQQKLGAIKGRIKKYVKG